jgi:2-(1,2-epoxy-1,2-dihydrophenyl)acetyl-CoA isomerase
MAYDMILVEDRDRVRTIALNRPERLNAMVDQMMDEAIDALQEADRDDAVNVIVITGSGRGFCAGLDLIARLNAPPRTPSRHQRLDDFSWVGRQALVIASVNKPVIAAVNGAAAGAGLSLALAADVRVMAAGARLTTGYARRGLSPDGGMSYTLPRMIGTTRAFDLIYTGRDVTADEALQIGMVAAIYPDESFREDAHAYATRLAANAPIGMGYAKKLLAQSLANTLPAQLQLELNAIGKAFQTEDVKEALRAFQEKRPPVFSGR